MIRVLIVDDHAMMIDGLTALLKQSKHIEVIGSAFDGRSALGMVDELSPDVVLMDIALPGLNGLEATRLIIQKHPTIKVVILSVHATNEHIFQALRAGAKGYLLKESAGNELLDAIQEVYSGNRYLTHKVTESLVNDYIQQRERSETNSLLDVLSTREREVFYLVVEGYQSAEIAKKLSLSRSTVDTYRSRIMTKLGIDDLPSLIRFALEHGLIS
jgi:DNA-binding NarL/FixJ family response regulator